MISLKILFSFWLIQKFAKAAATVAVTPTTPLAMVSETTLVTDPTMALTNTLVVTPAVRNRECIREGSWVLWVKKEQFKLVK